jgi:hypothetical protein
VQQHLAAGLLMLACAGPVLAQDAVDGRVLQRDALLPPALYRVLVVPGSGCVSLAPSAARLWQGLPHAQVMLLQKPHLNATDAPCSVAYLQTDRLGAWLDRARRLSQLALAATDASLPLVLVGLSEGAELLPALAQALPATRALVMVGNAGLDPAVTGRLQARRLGVESAWQSLLDRVATHPPDDRLVEGRHWRYWSDLSAWPLQQPLLDDPRPLLHAWGGQDRLISPDAYAAFGRLARQRAGGYCGVGFAQADHELRQPDGRDHLQTVWQWLETLALEGRDWRPNCDTLTD